jgi:hypothetical protein
LSVNGKPNSMVIGLTIRGLKGNFQLVPNHSLTNREKNLQDS